MLAGTKAVASAFATARRMRPRSGSAIQRTTQEIATAGARRLSGGSRLMQQSIVARGHDRKGTPRNAGELPSLTRRGQVHQIHVLGRNVCDRLRSRRAEKRTKPRLCSSPVATNDPRTSGAIGATIASTPRTPPASQPRRLRCGSRFFKCTSRLGTCGPWAGLEIANNRPRRGRVGKLVAVKHRDNLVERVPILPPRQIDDGRGRRFGPGKQPAHGPIQIHSGNRALTEFVDESQRRRRMTHITRPRVRIRKESLVESFQPCAASKDQKPAQHTVEPGRKSSDGALIIWRSSFSLAWRSASFVASPSARP